MHEAVVPTAEPTVSVSLTEGEPARMLRHRGDAVELLRGGMHVDSYPVEMARDRAIRIEQLVAAPRAAVWADLADLSSHGQWMMDAAAITVDPGVPGVGTRMEVITRIGPLHTTDHMVVIEWDPPRRMAVRHRGRVSGEGRFTLEDCGDDTMVRWIERLEFPWTLGGPAGALAARPLLAAVWRANLRRFAARFA